MSELADITIDAVLARISEIAPELRANGVTRLALFGSRARGDARPDSDLDVLIETSQMQPPPFDYFKVLRLIEQATGLQVQISQRKLLKPRIAERIADDLIEVF
jgi:predicted nucleotidyltransferase